jgi:hypothetical protein
MWSFSLKKHTFFITLKQQESVLRHSVNSARLIAIAKQNTLNVRLCQQTRLEMIIGLFLGTILRWLSSTDSS